MNKNTSQHISQLKYFGKEFSQLNLYHITPWQESYLSRIKKYLLKNNLRKSNITILDIATGSGYVAMELAKNGYKVLACDLAPESITKLKQWKKEYKLTNLTPFVSSAERINLSDNSVDYIIANAILEHIADESKAISEWKRILKKKGRIFITVPIKHRYLWPFLWPLNWWYDRRLGHLRRYDLKELKHKFGLSVLYEAYTGHLIKTLGVIVSSLFSISFFDQHLETIDAKSQKNNYGSSNIIVVLEDRHI